MRVGDVIRRAQGALLGVAVGDALGATTEFMTPSEIRHRHGVHRKMVGGGWLHLRPGQVTDDTQMSLCISRALVAEGRWDVRAVADRFVAWLRSRPVDVGATCLRGIRRYMHGGTTEAPPNDWDAGNGALMRMAPVALYTLGDDALLVRLAREQAHLTHNHPLSDAACVAVGRLVHAALLGASLEELRAGALEVVARHPNFRFAEGPGPGSPYVADTIRAVFHPLFSSTDFEQCLIRVVNQGGDADTAGAVAGMIAGAHYGPEAIPSRWTRRLERGLRDELAQTATRLVELSPLGRSPACGDRPSRAPSRRAAG